MSAMCALVQYCAVRKTSRRTWSSAWARGRGAEAIQPGGLISQLHHARSSRLRGAMASAEAVACGYSTGGLVLNAESGRLRASSEHGLERRCVQLCRCTRIRGLPAERRLPDARARGPALRTSVKRCLASVHDYRCGCTESRSWSRGTEQVGEAACPQK